MIMDKLLKYTESFSASRPIMRLGVDYNRSRNPSVYMDVHDVVYKFEPKPIEGDVLSELVCSKYREDFNKRDLEFVVDKQRIADNAMGEIRSFIIRFIEKNLAMKNPRQSKLYRWANNDMPNKHDLNEALILLYVYIKKHTYDDGFRIKEEYKEHLNNTMAILDALREKYEE